jgi:hypothetical protein
MARNWTNHTKERYNNPSLLFIRIGPLRKRVLGSVEKVGVLGVMDENETR